MRQKEVPSYEMKSKETLGEIIKRRRHTLALTQRELAVMLGVKPSHVAYLESGRRRPSLTLLKQLADVLHLDRQQIFLLAHPEAKPLLTPASKSTPELDPAKSWLRFAGDPGIRERHHITAREIKALKHLSLLGYVLTQREFLAVLSLIRGPEDG
jgi:transcriptional regulator with XRE-family HTH domain